MKKLLLYLVLFMLPFLGSSQVYILDEIVPAGSFPTTEGYFVKGGFYAFADAASRDALLVPMRRVEGQFVYVTNEAKFYQLQGGIDNANWVQVKMGDDVLLDLSTYVFDTIRLSNNNTNIWQLRVSGDTLYYNDEIFVNSAAGGSYLTLDVDRPINYIANGANLKNLIGYSPMRLDSLLDYVLYADSPPTVALSVSPSVYENGAAPTLGVSWSVTKSDIANTIDVLTMNGTSLSPTGNNQSGTYNDTPTANKTYTIYAEENTGLYAQASTSVSFRDRLYVTLSSNPASPGDTPFGTAPGDASSPYFQMTDSDIANNSQYDPLTTAYNANTKISLSNVGSDGRVVVIAPIAFGEPQISMYSNSQWANMTKQKEWNFTNREGYSTTYCMYVGNQQITTTTAPEIKVKKK